MPEREGVPGMRAAVRELAHRLDRQLVERLQLSHPCEVEQRVAAERGPEPPDEGEYSAPAPATAQTTRSKWSASRRIANGSAIAAAAPSTTSVNRIDVPSANVATIPRKRTPSESATASATAGRRSARAISAPGMSRQSEAASRNASPSPSAGSRRATASSGSPRERAGSGSTRRLEQSGRRSPATQSAASRYRLRARREQPTAAAGPPGSPPRMLGRGDPRCLRRNRVPAHLLAEERRRLASPRGAADVHRLGLRVEERPPARGTARYDQSVSSLKRKKSSSNGPTSSNACAGSGTPPPSRTRPREPRRAGIPRRRTSSAAAIVAPACAGTGTRSRSARSSENRGPTAGGSRPGSAAAERPTPPADPVREAPAGRRRHPRPTRPS